MSRIQAASGTNTRDSGAADAEAASEVRAAQLRGGTSGGHRAAYLPLFGGGVKEWAGYRFQMESVLDVEGLLEVVDKKPSGGSAQASASVIGGEEDEEEQDVESEAEETKEQQKVAAILERKRKQAFMLIVCSLKSPELMALIADVPRGNAYEVWSRLKRHFGGGNNPVRKQQLLSQFSQIKQKRGESVMLFAARIKEAVLELKAVDEKVSMPAMQAAFTSGLLSPEFDSLRHMLPMFGHKTLDETVNAAQASEAQLLADRAVELERQVEKAHYVRSTGGAGLQHSHFDRRAGHPMVEGRAGQPNFAGPVPYGTGRGGGGACFGCGDFGHKVYECPVPCGHCGVLGHSEDRCYKKYGRPTGAEGATAAAAGGKNALAGSAEHTVTYHAAHHASAGEPDPRLY